MRTIVRSGHAALIATLAVALLPPGAGMAEQARIDAFQKAARI